MNNIVEKKIGNNIKRLREAAGFTQDYIAGQLRLMGCDITRSAIAKIEVGQRHLYPDEVILLRKILDVEYDKIFKL